MLSFLCMAGKQFVDKKICTNFVAAHGVFLLKLRVSQDAKNKLPLGNWVKQAVGHIKAASSFPFSCIRNTEKKLSLFYSECHIPMFCCPPLSYKHKIMGTKVGGGLYYWVVL